MLSGYLLSVHNLITHLFAVPWFPLVLLFYIKYFENGKRRDLVYTALFLSMEFLAGAPEIVLMTGLVLAIFSVREVMLPRDGATVRSRNCRPRIDLGVLIRKRIIPAFAPIILVVGLFLLLTSVQLMPFVELKLNSVRKAGLTYEEATIWSLAWKDFILFFLPDAFGSISKFNFIKFWSYQSWLKTMYIGFIPLLLSIFYFAKNNRFRITFSITMIISFLLALGGSTPFYRLLHHFSPFDSIRYPIKFLFPFFFIIAVMSAMGLDSFVKQARDKDRKTRILVGSIFYLGCFFALLWGYVNLFESDVHRFLNNVGWRPESFNDIDFNLHNLKRLLFFSLLFCMALFFYSQVKSKRVVLTFLVLILMSDLFLASYGFYNSLDWQTYIRPYGFAEKLSRNAETNGRYLVTMRTMRDLEILFSRPPLDKMAFAPPYASLYRAHSLDGSEVMRIMHYDLFLRTLLFSHNLDHAKRFFYISDLQYLMTSYKMDDPDFAFSTNVTLNGEDVYLYEYLKRPGRFLLYGKTIYVRDDKEAIEKLADSNIDLRRELIIVSDERKDANELPDPNGHTELVSYSADEVALKCEVDSDAFLYVSDTYYAGWRAYVDGEETKIYRANLAFRAVRVPKGKHAVVFKYVPTSFRIGFVVTMFGIALCIWLWKREGRAKLARDNGEQVLPASKGSST